MDRDVMRENHEPWDAAELQESSILDRALILPLSSARWITAVLAVAAALFLRLIGLNRWPLDAHEADLALGAWHLAHGADVPHHLFGAPVAVEWTALFIFLGGTDDAIVRIGFALAGVLAVLTCLWMGRWIGTRAGVAAALLVALSPTMIAGSRTLDGGALLVALSLITIGAGLAAGRSAGIAWPITTGIVGALLWLSDPLGLPALLLACLAILLLRQGIARPRTEGVIAGTAAALATTVLSTTVLLTRPAGLQAALAHNFSRLWDEHLAHAGSHAYMPVFNLILNEPLLLVFAVIGIIACPHRDRIRALGMWTLTALIVMSVLATDSSAGYSIVVLPLALLAAQGAVYLLNRVPWWSVRQGPATLYAISVLLMLAALVSLVGLVTGGVGPDAVEWLLRFALIVLVGVLPLSLALTALGARLHGDRIVVIVGALLILFIGLTARSAVLAASERPGVPGDPLAVHALGADIPIVVGRLQRLSRDQTMGLRDSRDPTGGHGLRISVDEEVAQPFTWYFREYPNLHVFDPAESAAPSDAQIVILAGERDATVITPDFRGQAYVYGHVQPDVFRAPDWGGLITGLVNPNEWRSFAAFLINRKPAAAPAATNFQVLATPDLAQQLFPASGPFSLDERPGAGSADGQFNRPRGIAVATDGTIYVVDSRNARVEIFDPSGQFVRAFGSAGPALGQLGQFNTEGGGGPNGIAIGDNGEVFVADTWNHRIAVFGADGQYQFVWGAFADLQNSPDAQQQTGMFYGPRGIAFHDGLVYVTDTGNERVQVFTPDGTFVRAFGGYGSGDGQLLEPVGIAIASDGTVLVADSHNARIARFTTDGTWLGAWPIPQWEGLRFFEPYLALGDDDTLYVTTSQGGYVLAIDRDGVILSQFGQSELRQPFGIAAISGSRTLLVTDGALNAVVRVPMPPK